MKRFLGLIGILTAWSIFGTEFFVSPDGSNGNSGVSPDQPYKTLKRAADVMKPGDTMTLLPGEYRQGLEWDFEGGEAVTTIRAAIPGTAVLRGDIDAPVFAVSEHSPRIWQCAFPHIPQAVNERDTLSTYERMPSAAELEFAQGSWFYDENAKMLYVHTSDSASPQSHYLTISDRPAHGLLLNGKSVRNINIEGLVITGFNANAPGGPPGHNAKWGVYIVAPKNCTVRNVTTFLNGGGIGFSRNSSGCVIENCRSYANQSPFFGSGGNIIVLTPSEKTAIRNCVSFDSRSAGIRFYGGDPAQHCIFEDNISFANGYGDMWLKYPSDTTTARRCIAGKALYSRLIENCLFDYGDTGYFGTARNSIVRPREKDFDETRELADPWNHDYRPQADSRYRDRAPAPFSDSVYYVKHGGNDALDGNSVRNAWRSLDGKLKDGSTFYLLPDSRQSALTLKNLKNVTIRGRGPFPVKITGGVHIENCENIILERLEIDSLEASASRNITVNQCAVSGPSTLRGTADCRITHNTLNGIQLADSPGSFIAGNIFTSGGIAGNSSPLWSGYNSYAEKVPAGEPTSFTAIPEFGDRMTLKNAALFNARNIDAMPVGPYRRQPVGVPLELDGPRLLSSTATTANIEFHANYPVSGTIYYGKDASCPEKYRFRPQASFQSLSLSGLKPGQEYYFKITATATAAEQFSNQELPGRLSTVKREHSTPVEKFRTPARNPSPETYHVALNGNDRNPGTPEQPWRTISHAASRAVAGDTVLVHGGTYQETVRIRATGDKGTELTLAAAPGEKVWLDGNTRLLGFGFIAFNKNYITLDGFHFREIRQDSTAGTAGISLINTDHVTVSRCFYDGRSHGYTPYFILAEACRALTVANCFTTRAFHGMAFNNCPDLLIRNCVFYSNQINSCAIYNKPGEKAVLRNNIWVDNTLQKVGNPLINLTDIASLEESDNCFLLRVPENEKTIFGYNRFNDRELPNSDKGEVLDRQWRRQGRFGREMATYGDFLKRTGRKGSAVFTDPQFKALPEFIRFKDLADWEKNYSRLGKQHNEKEYHLRNGKYAPLDFADFKTRNPELIKRQIGLEAKAFD